MLPDYLFCLNFRSLGLEKVYVLLLLWRNIFSVSLGFVQWLILLLILRVQILWEFFLWKLWLRLKSRCNCVSLKFVYSFFRFSLNLSFQGDLFWQRLVCILSRLKFFLYFFCLSWKCISNEYLYFDSLFVRYIFVWVVWIFWIWDTILLTLRSKWIAFDTLKS